MKLNLQLGSHRALLTVGHRSLTAIAKRNGMRHPQERCAAKVVQSTESGESEEELWRAAIKLPMYWVAETPVMVKSDLSVVKDNSFQF